MAELKGSHMAEAGEVVTDAREPGTAAVVVGRSPSSGSLPRASLRQRSVTTVTTNVPGPQFPLYCLGREMLEYLPFVPISHGVRVGTAILSYNGSCPSGSPATSTPPPTSRCWSTASWPASTACTNSSDPRGPTVRATSILVARTAAG